MDVYATKERYKSPQKIIYGLKKIKKMAKNEKLEIVDSTGKETLNILQ